jgi:hypothetical protein
LTIVLVVAVASLAYSAAFWSGGSTPTPSGVPSAPSSSLCTKAVGSTRGSWVLHAGIGSPAYLCVRLHYYGSTPIQYNASEKISVMVPYTQPGSGTFCCISNASSRFVITALPANVKLANSTNDTGVLVVYAISGRPGSEGSYDLNLGWLTGSSILCGHDFTLISGTGGRDYTIPASCLTEAGATGVVFADVVGAANATGY